jgi:ribonuclease-3
MGIGKNIFELESKLGYKFRDVSYLERALTHLSYANEQKLKGIKVLPNERLEFLGDAVIQIIISEYLFNNYKKHREGALTKMRQRIVCEKTLAKIAAELNLGDYINLGHGEELTCCRERPKILADTLEALIAAIYLDSKDDSPEIVRNVVYKLFSVAMESDSVVKADYKTMLQQLAEQDGSSILEYVVTDETGPDHNKIFTVSAFINNNKVGEGRGRSKRQAEMQAAKMALKLFGLISK